MLAVQRLCSGHAASICDSLIPLHLYSRELEDFPVQLHYVPFEPTDYNVCITVKHLHPKIVILGNDTDVWVYGIMYHMAENIRQEKIFANFATCLHGQNCWSHIDDYTEDMATNTALAKIYSSKYFWNARIAGIGENFVR